jgi:hypothetical protein
MSFANPTRLRIGMHGEFEGRDFRLVGRVVMGTEEASGTYYWNEFNLESTSGLTGTLVFEETERGGEWRLFTMFEPEYPMTAVDAASKRVGDRLNLTDTEVRVTLRGKSRVFRIEGKAPEGEKLRAVANYFNAEAPGVMQVVSWTGDEVEFYNGVQLTSRDVERAFNLPKLVPTSPVRNFSHSSSSDSESYLSYGKFIFWAVIVAVVFLQLNGWNFSVRGAREGSAAKHLTASQPPLTTGSDGQWDGKHYRITAHALVEIAEVDVVFERHEYELLDDEHTACLLICGVRPSETNWMFCTPLSPYPQPAPQESAVLKCGEFVSVDGVTGFVGDLFQSTIRNVDNVTPTSWRNGDVSFGYTANTPKNFIFARWDKVLSRFYQGHAVSAKDFAAAFSK